MKKIFISVFTAVIVEVFASIIVASISKINVIEATKIIWKCIYNLIKSIIFFKIPLWIILILVVLFIVIMKVIYNFKNDYDYSKPWYSDYIKDEYKNVLYSWYYTNNYGTLDIKNFRPICSNCGGDLIEVDRYGNTHYGSPKLLCPNCDKIFHNPSYEEIKQAKVFVFNNLKKKQKELKKDDKEH